MKVTVITVCRNSEAFISEAIGSVLGQDVADLEYLIIDGGSTDATLDIVQEYAADSRLRWWSAPDNGISQAMNLGLCRACGDIVAFLHSDDCYTDSGVLSRVVEAFSSTGHPLWVTGGIQEIDGMGSVVRELPVRRFSRRRLLRNNIMYHPATFVRRETLIDAGGFDEGLRYAMDYDLWLRLAVHSAPALITQLLACFRVHPGSISSVNRLAALDEEYIVRKRYLTGDFSLCVHASYQYLRRIYERVLTARV